MKKRVLSILLAVTMLCLFVPTTVFAATNKAEEYYNNVIIKDAVNGVFRLNSIEFTNDRTDYENLGKEEFICDYFFTQKYSTDQIQVIASYDYDDPDKFVINVSYWDDVPDMEESYVAPDYTYSAEVRIAFNEGIAAIKATADRYADLLKGNSSGDENEPVTIYMEDMDVINMLFNTKGEVDDSLLINYSSEFKNILNNSNITAAFVSGAGERLSATRAAMGLLGLMHNNYIYSVVDRVVFHASNIFFVPSSTADTTDAIATAAKARIESYIGKEVTVEFVGEPSNDDSELMDSITTLYDLYGVDNYDFSTYYNITIDGKTYPFFIFRDDSRMIDTSFETGDIISGAKITSDSAYVPNDSVIEISEIDKSSDTAKELLAAFGLTDGRSFDIKLNSITKGAYISKLDDGTFKVYIPLTDDMRSGGALVAYYRNSNGTVEEHPVTIEGDYATFITDHFSIYTLGLETNNGNTGGIPGGNDNGNGQPGTNGSSGANGANKGSADSIANTADMTDIMPIVAMMAFAALGCGVLASKSKEIE